MRWKCEFENPTTHAARTIVVSLDPDEADRIKSLRARNDPNAEVKEMAFALRRAYAQVGTGSSI